MPRLPRRTRRRTRILRLPSLPPHRSDPRRTSLLSRRIRDRCVQRDPCHYRHKKNAYISTKSQPHTFPKTKKKSSSTKKNKSPHSHRQNSSINSPLLNPHIYLPENRLNNDTHALNASNEGGTSGCKSSLLQFSNTAISVRPACVSWWITCTPSTPKKSHHHPTKRKRTYVSKPNPQTQKVKSGKPKKRKL